VSKTGRPTEVEDIKSELKPQTQFSDDFSSEWCVRNWLISTLLAILQAPLTTSVNSVSLLLPMKCLHIHSQLTQCSPSCIHRLTVWH